MILKIETYTNEFGAMVTERVLLKEGGKSVKYDRFVGTIGLGVMTEAGPQVEKIDFPIEANSLDEAFTNFKSSADKFVQRLKEEESKANLALPQKPSGLILP
jgi:hypothetical protein